MLVLDEMNGVQHIAFPGRSLINVLPSVHPGPHPSPTIPGRYLGFINVHATPHLLDSCYRQDVRLERYKPGKHAVLFYWLSYSGGLHAMLA